MGLIHAAGKSLGLRARMGGPSGHVPQPSHPNDPLHGVTLETVLRSMVDRHGWPALAAAIPIRCFMFDPTIRSSLTFLRKNPWARKRLEDWYVHEIRHSGASRDGGTPPPEAGS